MTSPRIIFAGTPEFAATALQALIDRQFEIVAVYTQPDRPAGRGHKLTPSPVKKLALTHQIPVEQPVSFKDPEDIATLANYNADIMIVAAYGLILPKAVLDIPALGCLNIHASILPRWRGAAPIQRAIQAGDKETGITIMQMEAGLDTGPMLLKLTTEIQDSDTGGSLHDRLAELGGQAIVAAMEKLESLSPEPQDNSLATYASKLHKSESAIDWSQPADDIARNIRAFNPWPGTHGICGKDQIKIWEAEVIHNGQTDTTGRSPGTIIHRQSTGIEVACGKGSLIIRKLQLPGAKALSVTDFVNGNQTKLMPGEQFEAIVQEPRD
ncbi:methionyl-tRNA formyltransferase [Hahella sp. CCB-MM4]|uniref:methionyl-tRNA formyltransferase n=1 Tax=Hahella sp. (strain CCB-MM4) TaxID=1926491 RepID=UPI000B9C6633|nr:methionyl-tRNA formyltransferase [Hahella sp. CCB-MM4]OZG73327.1 methionyl-tRNA formyltransferase [Hahella sp. CCB-MM4]